MADVLTSVERVVRLSWVVLEDLAWNQTLWGLAQAAEAWTAILVPLRFALGSWWMLLMVMLLMVHVDVLVSVVKMWMVTVILRRVGLRVRSTSVSPDPASFADAIVNNYDVAVLTVDDLLITATNATFHDVATAAGSSTTTTGAAHQEANQSAESTQEATAKESTTDSTASATSIAAATTGRAAGRGS